MTEAKTVEIYLPHGDPGGMAVVKAGGAVVLRIPRSTIHDYELGIDSAEAGVLIFADDLTSDAGSSFVTAGTDLEGRILARDLPSERWHIVYVAVGDQSHWSVPLVGSLGALWVQQMEGAGINVNAGEGIGLGKLRVSDEAREISALALSLSNIMALVGWTLPLRTTAVPPGDTFFLDRRKAQARAKITGKGEVTVLTGSSGLADVDPLAPPFVSEYRERLLSQGHARISYGRFELLGDHHFDGLEVSASVIAGKRMNGFGAWKTAEGLTFRVHWHHALAAVA